MKIKIFIPVLMFLLFSCNNVTKENRTIIDNIVLGLTVNNFSKQMDSLSIPHQRFLTKYTLSNFEEIMDDNNYINMYYTSIFNFSKYRNNFNDNFGLLYPITLTGTQNNIGLIVLLGHTAPPDLNGYAVNFKSSLNTNFFRQDVNSDLIEQIKNLYISKYGKPKDEFTSKYSSFYAIKNNGISQYRDSTRVGREINWETEHFKVTFFSGLASYDSYYNPEGYLEVTMLYSGSEDFSPIEVDPLKNEMQCFSFAYIKYQLNEKTIKQLKLDNANL